MACSVRSSFLTLTMLFWVPLEGATCHTGYFILNYFRCRGTRTSMPKCISTALLSAQHPCVPGGWTESTDNSRQRAHQASSAPALGHTTLPHSPSQVHLHGSLLVSSFTHTNCRAFFHLRTPFSGLLVLGLLSQPVPVFQLPHRVQVSSHTPLPTPIQLLLPNWDSAVLFQCCFVCASPPADPVGIPFSPYSVSNHLCLVNLYCMSLPDPLKSYSKPWAVPIVCLLFSLPFLPISSHSTSAALFCSFCCPRTFLLHVPLAIQSQQPKT